MNSTEKDFAAIVRLIRISVEESKELAISLFEVVVHAN